MPAELGQGATTGWPSPHVPRIRSVISTTRPVFSARPQLAPIGQEALLPALQAVWDAWSPRIGRISMGGQALATGWRLPGTGNLVATAGHVLGGLLPEGDSCDWSGAAVDAGATISFDDDGAGHPLAILGCVMAHPRWDVAILRIEGPALAPPLPPLDLTGGAIQPGTSLAIIGYPGMADGTVFKTAGIRHLSLGLAVEPAEIAALLAAAPDPEAVLKESFPTPSRALAMHDASTLPGFSGAPVIDLATGRVAGLHVWGSEQMADIVERQDWNDMLDLWAVTREDWLAAWLGAGHPNQLMPLLQAQPQWRGGERLKTGECLRLHRLARRVFPEAQDTRLFRGIAADRPDDRDRAYTPSLLAPQDQMLPDPTPFIGDQGGEASCAAFATAAAIEQQLPPARRGALGFVASVRMLDAMARDHDEFLDDTAAGTTLRAVLKGFFHNGVCRAETIPYQPGATRFMLTKSAAREARAMTLGAYYRVAASLTDMQMAVQETKGVVVSAHIHAGWRPAQPSRLTAIAYDADDPPETIGAHAFLIVGYTDRGFIIRNSWGPKWGRWDKHPGHALWSYDDWAANVIDAWVLRLSPSTPSGFDRAGGDLSPDGLHRPRRASLLGHMLQIERDWIVEHGTLGLGRSAIAETAEFLCSREGRRRYARLGFVFHDPLMEPGLIARIAARMIPAMKARKTYPLHVSYGLDELRTLSLRLAADAEAVAQGFAQSAASPDRYLERRVALATQRLVADFRAGAAQALQGPLGEALSPRLSPRALTWAGGKARRVLLLSAGLGAIPALAASGLPGMAGARCFALAAPVQVPAGWSRLPLSPLGGDGEGPGYKGDWVDLLAAALAENAAPRAEAVDLGGDTWPSMQKAMIDRRFVARLTAGLDGVG